MALRLFVLCATSASALHWSGSPMPVHVRLIPTQPSQLAVAIHSLVKTDATRCFGCLESCDVESPVGLIGQIEQNFERTRQWAITREPILRWAASFWVETHLYPLELPPHLYPLGPMPMPMPFESSVSLGDALAPIQPKTIARDAFFVKPFRTVKLCWSLLTLWMKGKILPSDKARRHRRRKLAPIMNEIASTYSELVQHEVLR